MFLYKKSFMTLEWKSSIIEHKLEHIVLLHQNLLPLQALLDRVIDEPNNFNINLSDARLHRCEGTF